MNEIKTIRLTNRRIVFLVSVFLHLFILSTSGALHNLFESATAKDFLKQLAIVLTAYLVAWLMAYLLVRVMRVKINWRD